MDSLAFKNVVVAGGTGLVSCRLMEALMVHGALVTTAPYPVSIETFIRLVADRLHRAFRGVPGFLTAAVVRLLVGEMPEEMLLNGSFVQLQRAGELGFRFRFERLEQALAVLL